MALFQLSTELKLRENKVRGSQISEYIHHIINTGHLRAKPHVGEPRCSAYFQIVLQSECGSDLIRGKRESEHNNPSLKVLKGSTLIRFEIEKELHKNPHQPKLSFSLK